MKINQYEFLRDGKPFEPTREEIIQFAEHELKKKDETIKILKDLKSKEIGNALSQVVEYLSNVIKEKLDTATIIDCIDKFKQSQNQKAIECLKDVKNFIINYSELKGQTYNHTLDYLNKKIKELEGEE